MIPLWTTTIRPVQSRCGWAFSSVGRPCVAHRVWPTPYSPLIGVVAITSSRRASLPALRRRSMVPSRTTATPAESYPRYSSRRSPSIRIGTTGFDPMYPMIPHIPVSFGEVLPPRRNHGHVPLNRLFGFRRVGLLSLAPRFCPAFLVHLFSARDRQRLRGNVFGDRRSRGNVRTCSHSHRSNQLAVAANECAIFDN